MKIAIEGCCHGELDKIYESLSELERLNSLKVDLLIICGDFQAVRNFDDLQAMAVPAKFQQLNTFYKYYNGEKVAPVLTVIIGGNHEASNYMQELPYGGWVAPNIYYMGYAGIVQIGGIRIGGISGIYNGHDFNRGHHERAPYERDTIRSVYHVRNLEVFRLKQISRHVDIFISHDWPKGIYYHGDTASLVKRKPFFQQEIEENKLGSRPLSDLLTHLQPSYWFAAHLHVKFAAHVEHKPPSETEPAKCTKFLALDKCLPRRGFLQIIDLPHNEKEGLKIKLDPEWLTVLKNTNHLLNLSSSNSYMPGPGCAQRYDFTVSDQELEIMKKTFGDDLALPENFVQTSSPIGSGNLNALSRQPRRPLKVQVNPQTTLLCTMLDITDPNAKFLGKTSKELLDESFIGLPEAGDEPDNIDDDSGDDAVDNDDDDIDMPSTIDSSMDVSAASLSRNNSSSWDSFHTAKESQNSLVGLSPNVSFVGTSTPLRGFQTPLKPAEVKVDDDDDELLSILSAQKSKGAQKSAHLTSSPLVSSSESSLASKPLNDKNVISTPCDTTDSEKSHSSRDKKCLNSNGSPHSNCDSFGKQENREEDELQAILLAQKSKSLLKDEGNNSKAVSSTGVSSLSSPIDLPPPSLKSQCSSFGMSDLNLDAQISSSGLPSSCSSSTSNSPNGLRAKRASPDHPCEADSSTSTTPGSNISAGSGSGVKKLKRRNVSLYSEPSE